MSVIFRGSVAAYLQKFQKSYSPSSGYAETAEYKGLHPTAIETLYNSFANQGMEVTLANEHGLYTLQVKNPNGGTTLDTWQIQQQDLVSSVLYNPIVIANTNISEREIIRRAISSNVSPDQALFDLSEETGDTYIELGAYAQRIYDMMIEGTTEYVSSRYILRHTTNGPQTYGGANVADLNVDRIYSHAGLLNETQNGYYWLLPLPPALVTAVNNVWFPDVRANYYNGWLKRGSSRSTAANFRVDISTEYWAGQWSTDLYYLAS